MYVEMALGQEMVIWRSTGSLGAIVPADGCVDLILHDEDVSVAGPSTSWITTRADGDDGSVGLRFSPGAGTGRFALDLNATSDCVTPARDLMGRYEVSWAREMLQSARAMWPHMPGLIAPTLTPAPSNRPWSSFVHGHAQRGTPPWRVAELLGWSQRTFRRRMLADFGYPYSTLMRIERAHRAQNLLRAGAAPVDAAARAGYADQPHLSREFRRLVGASPAQFASSAA